VHPKDSAVSKALDPSMHYYVEAMPALVPTPVP